MARIPTDPSPTHVKEGTYVPPWMFDVRLKTIWTPLENDWPLRF